MIIKDDHGEILIDSRVNHLLIDQNGNHWELTDEGDGLALELLGQPLSIGISIMPLAARTVKVKPDSSVRTLPPSMLKQRIDVDHS
jgi:hypothetical protein